jgi:hypothetical protein
MKKNKPFVIGALILLAIISTSCNNQNVCDLTDDQKKLISNEIETIVKNFFNPNTLTYETHTALRANKEGYVMGGEGKILFTDYDTYNKSMKSGFAGIQRFTDFETVAIYVYVLAKDAATCTTEFKSKFLTTAGDTVINNGCWTFVFKKFDNEWKVIQENGTHLRE